MLSRLQFGGLCAALVVLFLWLGWTGGVGNGFDVSTVSKLAALRHQWPERTMAVLWLTKLGGATFTLSLAAIAGIWLWARGERKRILLLTGTVLLGRLVADTAKLLYDRPRPAIDLHPILTHSSSYPSGHAANSMVTFVALAMFAAPQRLRRPAVATAIVVAVSVALTRPYLGVHWPSDMIGGWAVAALVLLAARRVSCGGTIASDCLPASPADR